MTTATDRDAAPPYDPTVPVPETADSPYDPELKKAGELASPTWELELFLSGAFVFATFQLPGLIESGYVHLEPHVTEASAFMLTMAVLYGKAIAFTLIAMFSLHLGLRAYWVALMGLRSVFPRGIRWDQLRVGPIAREVYRERVPEIKTTIERIDNVSSVIFSIGLLIVALFVSSTTLLAVFGGLGFLAAQYLTHGQGLEWYLAAFMLVFAGIPLVATRIDQRRGDKLPPGSPGHARVRRLLIIGYRMNPVRLIAPMMWTVMSNVGRRKSMVFMIVALSVLILLSAADRLANSARLGVNTDDFFALSRTNGVDYRFYEDQRETGKPYPRTPSIQSDVIKDPYVKLFIPYYPARHNAAMARACPTLKHLRSRGLHIGAGADVADSLTSPALDCLAQIHAVKLDGAPITDIKFSFYEQPSTGVEGIIAYVAADSLARGQHRLEVLPIPPAELPTDSVALRTATWKKPYIISFWK